MSVTIPLLRAQSSSEQVCIAACTQYAITLSHIMLHPTSRCADSLATRKPSPLRMFGRSPDAQLLMQGFNLDRMAWYDGDLSTS